MIIHGFIMTFPSKVDNPDGMWINHFFLLQNICSDIAVSNEACMKEYTFHRTTKNITWKSFMTVVNIQPNAAKLVSILLWK
jgi:hypothetical protein